MTVGRTGDMQVSYERLASAVMEALLVLIAVLVVCGIVAVLFNRGVDAAFNGFNRNVLSRSDNRKGEEIVRSPLIFTTGAPVDTVASILDRDVTPYRQKQRLSRLYFADAARAADGSLTLRYCVDGKLGAGPYGMEALVVLRPHGLGTAGSVDITKWTVVDGAIMPALMLSLRNKVKVLVTHLDPAAQFSDALAH